MVYIIAALDSKKGIANNQDIPWDLPGDRRNFQRLTTSHTVIMGFKTYETLKSPLKNRDNFVLLRDNSHSLRTGFKSIVNLEEFFKAHEKEVVWIIGGADLYSKTLNLADKLYLTQVTGDFNATKFFPDFNQKFKLESSGQVLKENNIRFYFEVWIKK